MQKVVHCQKEPYDVYIGRAMPRYGLAASKWANPYRIGPDGDREHVLALYELYIRKHPYLMGDLPELRQKVLGCWCAPKGGLTADDPLRCHGQVLLRLLEEAGQ